MDYTCSSNFDRFFEEIMDYVLIDFLKKSWTIVHGFDRFFEKIMDYSPWFPLNFLKKIMDYSSWF